MYSPLSLREIRKLLDEKGRRIKRSLGQNYLIDRSAIDRITQASISIAAGRPVVEIGAGLGALTGALLASSLQVLAVETDRFSADFLRSRFSGDPHFTLDARDFLEIETFPPPFDNDIILMGNLPYHATSPILFRSFEYHGKAAGDFLFMVQREVADRILAGPHKRTYGKLTVLCRFFCQEIRPVTSVGPPSFYPAPSISSSVIHFHLRKSPLDVDPGLFKTLVFSAFSMRRKKLKKALLNTPFSGIAPTSMRKAIEKHPHLSEKRAENLTLEDYLSLAKSVLPSGESGLKKI